jgi:hypothetical protein
MDTNMIEPPCLTWTIVGRGPFQADFVASEKWFRRNLIDCVPAGYSPASPAPVPIALKASRPRHQRPRRVSLGRPLCAAICRSNNAALCRTGSFAGNQRWSKALNPQQKGRRGSGAHDDFTGNTLGNDVILDAKRRFAGFFALARWNWS